jgi:hypothetical protein
MNCSRPTPFLEGSTIPSDTEVEGLTEPSHTDCERIEGSEIGITTVPFEKCEEVKSEPASEGWPELDANETFTVETGTRSKTKKMENRTFLRFDIGD